MKSTRSLRPRPNLRTRHPMPNQPEREERGFQPIGSLATRVSAAASRRVTASSRSSGLPTDSATIGSAAQISKPASSTGTALSTTTSEARSLAGTLRSGAGKYLDIQRALERSLPLRSIVRDGVTVGWAAGWDLLPGMTAEHLRQAAQLLTLSLSPCPDQVIERELTRMSVLTKHRDPENAPLMLEELIARMRSYPADVVRDVAQSWPDEHTFFPSWEELRSELEWRVEKRRAMKKWVEKEIECR